MGGHGERIAQCATVRLRTLKTIPIQIDGEPSRLPPASISIALHSRANCILRSKKRPQLERQRGCVMPWRAAHSCCCVDVVLKLKLKLKSMRRDTSTPYVSCTLRT